MHIAITLAVATTLLVPCACDVESESTDRLAQVDAINAQSCNTMSNQRLIDLAMAQGGLSEDASMNQAFDEMTRRQEESVAAMVGLELSIADALESDELSRTSFDASLEVIRATARAEGSAVVVALDTAHDRLEPGERAMLVDALPEPSGPPVSEDGEMPPPPLHVQRIFDAIELDDEQHVALREALDDRSPPPPMPIELDSFADDDFEADALGLVELTESRTLDRANRDLDLITALLSVIDDRQREALVKHLREGPDDEGQPMPS